MINRLFALFFCVICFSNGLFAAPKTEIKSVVFDFGGVVAKADRSKISKFLIESLNLPEEDVRSAFKALRLYEAAGGFEQNFWKEFALSKGIALPQEWFSNFDKVFNKSIVLIPGTIAIIEELQKQGYQTPLLSNITTAYHARIVRNLGYYRWFDPVLLSYEIGAEKPDPRAYNILLETICLPPESVVFIDDKIENVEAAKKLGIIGIHFIDPEQLRLALKSVGVHLPILQ